MTDSPAQRIPLDPKEQPILESLLSIRTRLELLKQDRTSFFKTEDVMQLYSETITQVNAINEQRTNKREEQNRVDTVLDDCFQLISLAFMTIGKNSEVPAIYSVVSTIKRLLDHLKEAAFYSAKDLETITLKLEEYRHNIEKDKEGQDPHLVTLLTTRMEICRRIVAELKEPLSHLTPELAPVYEKLVSILRSLSACNVRSKYPKQEIDDLNKQLKEIQEKLHETGITEDQRTLEEMYADMLSDASKNATAPPQKLVKDLLIRCLLWSQIIEQRHCKIGEGFQDTFERLLAIRNSLESRSLLQSWSLRETDLYDYQRRLDRFDEARTADGNFVNQEGNLSDLQTQRTLLYLLRKSYALIYQLLTSSEPVSEALLPIYNQLKTLKKCLREVKKAGGISSPRELYPYSMKLNSIDNLRVDGKFMVGQEIPDGQAAVMQLLEDCFELTHDLKVQAEEDNDDATHSDEAVHLDQ